jgi:UTP--glucose-1-phosphate uridylyltransferase
MRGSRSIRLARRGGSSAKNNRPVVQVFDQVAQASLYVQADAYARRMPRPPRAWTRKELKHGPDTARKLFDKDRNAALAAEQKSYDTLVDVDSDYFKLVRDFKERFRAGPPSLIECERLILEGGVEFGAGVVVRGSVTVRHEGPEKLRIDAGMVLEDDRT